MSEWTPGAKLPEPIRRPAHELNNYPIELRWNFVRRHPYYASYWQEVARYHENPPDDPRERREFGYRAKLLLGGIGVYGPPVSPESKIEAILEGTEPALLSGSLQPMTFRVMASLLLQSLDPEAKEFLASLLLETANAAGDNDRSMADVHRVFLAALTRLNSVALPGFERFADAPLYFVHVGASLSSIESDAVDQAKRWKKRRRISDPPKIRKDKYAGYLQVWDLREGWSEGVYDRTKELKLREIAERLGEPISTVASRYKQAFRLVVGVDYSPSIWMQAFWSIKLVELFLPGNNSGRANVKRRTASLSRRPIPVSKLGWKRESSIDNQTPVDHLAARSEFSDYHEALSDFRSMVEEGRTDQQIAKELGIELGNVQLLRDRLEDFKDL